MAATAVRGFRDRTQAGRLLAGRLRGYAGLDGVVVLGLPRGGVPVAFEVARELDAPLDVFLVRKLGLPGQEELAIGAVATGGTRVLNQELIDAVGLQSERARSAPVRATRQHAPAGVFVAVPVADPKVCEGLRAEADEVVCL